MTDTTPQDPAPRRPAEEPTPTVASLLQRVGARVLDTGIVLMLTSALDSLCTALFALKHSKELPDILPVLLFFAVFFLYEGALLARRGRTLGKQAVGIRVASYADGSPPGRAGWVRAAVYALPGAILCLGNLFWLFNVLSCVWDRPYRQCLHDKSAKTVVVTV